MFRGIGENIFFRIKQQHFFRRAVAQDGDQCRIHIQKAPFQTGAVNPVHRTLDQRAVARLGTAQRLLVALDLDRAGQLPRHKG